MPDLLEHMYCSQQINIPPNLPFILKQYAKAAIRTQPYDLLYWSAAYFRAKADNVPPPVKERLEYPPMDSPSRLSPGFLKVLHKQLGAKDEVSVETLYEKWLGVCLVKEALDSMLKVGSMTGKVPWLKFVAIAAGHLCSSLSKTMIMVCEVLTEEPDGGSAMIPVDVFVTLYEYLARMDCGPQPSPDIPLQSVTTATSVLERSESSVCSVIMRDDGKPKDTDEELEKDSKAGLMVWPDVKPTEQADTLRSPRYQEELGAASDVGVEVLDNATGVVEEVVTLFPVQAPTESIQTIPLPSSTSKQSRSIDENVLSHSSLKDNEDWIKIEQRKLNGEITEQGRDEVDTSLKGQDEMDTSLKGQDEVDTSLKGDDEVDASLKSIEDVGAVEGEEPKQEEQEEEEKELEGSRGKVSAENEEILPTDKDEEENFQVKSVTGEEENIPVGDQIGETDETKGLTSVESDGKLVSTTSKEDDAQVPAEVSLGQQEESVDSFMEPGESVTVQHFVRDDLDGSTITYSTGEIRKDYFGDKSDLKIHRSSDDNVVKGAATVHPLTLDEESSVLLPAVKVSSDELSSEDTRSFVVLEEDNSWRDVPGIGPVIPEPQILAVVEYMHYWAAKQEGMVMPRNVNHILCPPLDIQQFPQDSETESHY